MLKLLTEGQNWKDLPEELHEKALGSAYNSWGGRVGFCRRLSWDSPSPTLTTSPIGRATSLCHPSDLRPLTITEYAKIQQFPEDWQFYGSIQQKYTQIGNAVPIGLGEAIGKSINNAIKKTNEYGVNKNADILKGTIICDKTLTNKIKNRNKTQLHPKRLLKNSDPKEIRKWLELSA